MRDFAKRIYVMLLGCVCALGLSAQYFQSSYFMEGMPQRHYLNPALAAERNFVSIPLAGQVSADIHGNLDLRDLIMLRTINGERTPVTFLHPAVGLDELRFKDNSILSQDARVQLVGFGFHAFGGFNTLDVNLREYAGMHAPIELMTLFKSLSNQNYHVGKVGARAMAWTELGFGHSRQVTKRLRVGAKAKFLIGLARMDAKLDGLDLNLADTHRWTAMANANVDVSLHSFRWGKPQYKEYAQRPGVYPCISLDNASIGLPGPDGIGAAVDLGVDYTCGRRARGLKFSMSIVDFGMMRWRETVSARNHGTPVVFEGFQDIALVNGHGSSIKDLDNDLLDRVTDLYAPQDAGSKSVRHLLGATVHIGLEYTPHRARFVKLGLLCTQRLEGQYSSNEARLSAALVGKWAELGVSTTAGTFGPSWGWVLNFKPRGFNLYVGMDRSIGRMAKPCIPLRSNASVTCGLNVTLGPKRK